MSNKQKAVQRLYRKLLNLYPRAFKEHLGESMQQTFDDLYNEQKRQTVGGMSGFLLWIFLETAIGILKEHLPLISPGVIMRTILRTFGLPVLISILFISPFMVMEIVNRRGYGEDFPFMLFFILWLNTFAICLILLPVVRAWRTGGPDTAEPVSAQGTRLVINPWSTALISAALLLSPFILIWLGSLGLVPLDRLVNGPDPEVVYLPGLFISLGLYSLILVAGVIARGPVVRTLQAGGGLLAYPVHLLLVVVIVSGIAFGLASLIIDQWPCFIGVPACD